MKLKSLSIAAPLLAPQNLGMRLREAGNERVGREMDNRILDQSS